MALMPLPEHEALDGLVLRRRIDALLSAVPPERALLVDAPRRDDLFPYGPCPITRVPYLNLITEGGMTVHRAATDKPLEVTAGTALLFLPGSAVAVRSAGGYRMLRITWDTTLTFVALSEHAPRPEGRPASTYIRPRIQGHTLPGAQPPLTEGLLSRCQDLHAEPDPVFALPYLLTLVNEVRAQLTIPRDRDDRRRTRWEDLERYMRRHIHDCTRARAARAMGVSEGHIGRLVRQHTGLSFVGYLRKLRMEVAEQLLRDSQKEVQEIARHCGFTNTSHFIRLFQRHSGKTPAAWRTAQQR